MHEVGGLKPRGVSNLADPMDTEVNTHRRVLRSSTQRKLNVSRIFCAEYEHCWYAVLNFGMCYKFSGVKLTKSI